MGEFRESQKKIRGVRVFREIRVKNFLTLRKLWRAVFSMVENDIIALS